MPPEYLSIVGPAAHAELSLRVEAAARAAPAVGSQATAHRPESAINFAGLLFFTIALRIAARSALPQPSLAAEHGCAGLVGSIASGHWLTVGLTREGLCAITYPLGLAAAGSSGAPWALAAFVVCMALAVASAVLVRQIARAIGAGENGQLLAVFAYALWLPGIISCTMAAPESFVTPALLLMVWLMLRLRPARLWLRKQPSR